jgi:hypothetical protein
MSFPRYGFNNQSVDLDSLIMGEILQRLLGGGMRGTARGMAQPRPQYARNPAPQPPQQPSGGTPPTPPQQQSHHRWWDDATNPAGRLVPGQAKAPGTPAQGHAYGQAGQPPRTEGPPSWAPAQYTPGSPTPSPVTGPMPKRATFGTHPRPDAAPPNRIPTQTPATRPTPNTYKPAPMGFSRRRSS